MTDVQDQLNEVYRELAELNNTIEQHVTIAIRYVTLCTLLCHIVPYCVLCYVHHFDSVVSCYPLLCTLYSTVVCSAVMLSFPICAA